MKKLMAMMIGLGLMLGTVSVAFGQDTSATASTEKKTKKKTAKKKAAKKTEAPK